MDWMIFGGIGLISEMGRHSQDNHIKQLNNTRSGIAKVLCCDTAFEREMWNLVCDPSGHELVWERIETFKRDNPHLCVGRSNWDFVGNNRLIIENTGRKTMKMDNIIADNRSKVVSLLCRTHGKLSSIQAGEVSMHNSFYLCWSALPNDEIYPVWNQSASKVRSLKDTFASLKVQNIERLPQLVREASGEQHDAIVYMVGMEFDPSKEAAVQYITNCLKKIVNLTVVISDIVPNGVFRFTSSEQYADYLTAGGESNEYIEASIRDREQREVEAKSKAPPFNTIYIPNGGDLPKVMNDILWADAVIKSPSPTLKDNAKQAKDLAVGTYFDGSFSGLLMFLLTIVAIISVIYAIK